MAPLSPNYTDWVELFAAALIRLAETSGHDEKANFARAFAHDIGRCYLADGDLPEALRNPHEAAAFEFKCWAWWGRKPRGRLGLPERA